MIDLPSVGELVAWVVGDASQMDDGVDAGELAIEERGIAQITLDLLEARGGL